MMLSVYGDTDVDLDGIWDSSDVVWTWRLAITQPSHRSLALHRCTWRLRWGPESDEDDDGICDDVDPCIGVIDECGVCNGPGPTEVVIENITILYDSVYAEQIDQ